ncbi:hypothetical protein HN51_053381 [Arachis hypogaea]|uniref:Putative 2-oxoglutarate-dependent dioxygenase AOP1 n=1 Tax=Arachis hypogaea TaxID=3818 RepID=A0A444XCC8_ARAHY|nr:probable 2-oxoglutarate-dependent dioxygenase AOP1 [Arachis ipaensis]XP_025677399.1 probable 2-oxoglutarate-dependent dioxygenase AOP1 [Arachis hypogaea]QHN75719.1 putative 2-oxoglutarate-dependent dioxygenase AOP1 [Arachis hypogaea]RYQ87277.1 hypothetical protein Ahy_B09g094758 [Arachis hypogaea]
MGTETPLKLPTIDFNDLNMDDSNNNCKWEEVKSKVHNALIEYGCFEAIFDKVPLELCKDLFPSLEELFDLPIQTKKLNASKKPYHGYVGQFPMVPLYESMGIDDANVLEKVEAMTNILWPNGNPNFSKTIHCFSEKLSELDKIIRKMVLESLGVEKYLEEHMNSTNYLIRVMKYKGPQTSETKLGLSSHTDKNVVTILCQNQVDGLEILTKDGKWISFKPSQPGTFIAMIGDALHSWSNGRLHSAFHRVMMSGNEARYSAGLFSIPNGGYLIKAPQEMVDDDHPLLFKPYDHVHFLNYYYSPQGQTDQFALRTYCGL